MTASTATARVTIISAATRADISREASSITVRITETSISGEIISGRIITARIISDRTITSAGSRIISVRTIISAGSRIISVRIIARTTNARTIRTRAMFNAMTAIRFLRKMQLCALAKILI